MRAAVFFLLVSIIFVLVLFRSAANSVSTSEILLVPHPLDETKFLWNKKSLDDPSLHRSDGDPIEIIIPYINANTRLPNLRSCLLPGAVTDEYQDVLRTNWKGIHSEPELEVCVFRIAAALKNSHKILDWAMRSGFEAKMYSSSTGDGGSVIFGSWPRSRLGSLTPFPRSLLQDFFERKTSDDTVRFRIAIFIDKIGAPINVQSGIPFK